MTMVVFLLGYLVAINALAYAAFRADKARAIRGDWRIGEHRLIGLAVLGGWPGAKTAQKRFRHKTRKQPFARVLNAVPLIWVGLIAAPLAFGVVDGVALGLKNLIALPAPSAQEEAESPRQTPKFFTAIRD